jgi:glycosyltransferase involved in cell wall biosynthesis
MRICQVNPGCGIPIPPPSWGAIEKIVWEFTCNLKKLGHEVDIKWANEIQPGEYDLVMVHVANLALELADRGIPYIFQHHDHHAYHYGKDSDVYKQNREAMRRSIFSLVPARYLVEYFNLPNVHYFSHGVDTKTFYPNETPPIDHNLLMLANNGLGGYGAHDRKGFELGIKVAMARNLPITIAGPENNNNWFSENPWIFGYPKLKILQEPLNEHLRQIYTSYTIFLHPSELEAGHPNLTLLEAAACGLPILGWIEMDTIFHGLWRAPRDIKEMLRGLDTIIEEYDSYKNSAIKTAKELSWYNRSKELIKLYERHINKGIQ